MTTSHSIHFLQSIQRKGFTMFGSSSDIFNQEGWYMQEGWLQINMNYRNIVILMQLQKLYSRTLNLVLLFVTVPIILRSEL